MTSFDDPRVEALVEEYGVNTEHILSVIDAADAAAGVRRCWWEEYGEEWVPVGEPPS
jgi:hypothetical protein